MRIVNASAYLIKWPFLLPVEHSLATNSATENLVVKVVDGQGRAGFGEGVPRGYVTGETLAGAVAALEESFLPGVMGREIDPYQALDFLPQHFPRRQLDAAPAAGCALEIALLDLAGQNLGQPLSAFLGDQVRNKLVYSAVIPLTSRDRFEELLADIERLGLKEIKIKVGRDDDLEVVGLVRQALGPEVRLRVDANGAWSVGQAIERINQLAALGVEAVEQPLPKEDLAGLAEVTGRAKPLILADESLCTADEAQALIRAGGVGGFNLRLSKCGGLARTEELFDLARQAGLVCQLGCQVGELGLLSAAGRHFAMAHPELIHLEGSLTRFLVGQDIIFEDISFGPAGLAEPLTGPGLGVKVDESKLIGNRILSLP